MVCWAFLYIFSLFLAYYVLRPIRDELGVAGGVRNLPWLFGGTLLAMIAVSPLFAWVVKRLPRGRFVPLCYRFFMLHLILFALLTAFAPSAWQLWTGRIFFIWVSVFNLFVVSVFWSFAVDIFSEAQSKRLFGLLAAGATLGGIAGSALTSALVEHIGQIWLMAVSVALLELAVQSAKRLEQYGDAQEDKQTRQAQAKPVGGGLLSGMKHTFSSPYLCGIALFILGYAMTGTILYFHQAALAEQYFTDRVGRTAFFAEIDLWVNALTLLFQLFLTGKLMGKLGITLLLCILPLVSMAGFGALALAPASLGLFVAVQVIRRVVNFAFARPAREVLYTAVSREDRYKTKNFIDTVVYRSGDQIAGWSYAGLLALGLGSSTIAAIAVPFCAIWLLLAWWLGRQQARGKAQ
nr:MFS transporter [Neisseria perflava]